MISAISMLLERYAVNVDVIDEQIPRVRPVQWGRRAGYRYLRIELPSWEWAEVDFGRRQCWCQRVFWWNERYREWGIEYVPC